MEALVFELLIKIYCIGIVSCVVYFILADEFVRDNDETARKYALRCAWNIVWSMFWPLLLLLGAVCWAVQAKMHHNQNDHMSW